MKFQEIDATTLTHGLLGHGVNRKLAMGSGIAGALARKWPNVRDKYLTRKDPVPKLGSVDLVKVYERTNYAEEPYRVSSLIVANCYTQDDFGGDGKRYADVDAVIDCCYKLLVIGNAARMPVYIPRIGCELGGLDWHTEVKPGLLWIEKEFSELVIDQHPGQFLSEFIVIDVPCGKWGNS